MIFNIVNLDLLTCIQKIEVPYKWQNELKKENLKQFKFEFEIQL
jgi:hypothetical protein